MPTIISGSTGISGTDGTAATPAVQGTDTNTGIFFPAADTIAFAEGGTEVMRIDSNGNVGIGISSPGYPLTVFRPGATDCYAQWYNGGGGNFIIGTVSNGNALLYNAANSPMVFVTNNLTRAIITAGGDFQFNSGYGSVATAFGCRAWVNFNGTGTVAIRASGNVSSITDNGVGAYTVNFTNAMPDANYCFQGNGFTSKTYNEDDVNVVRSTTAIRFAVREATNATFVDVSQISVAIFR